MKIEDLNGRTIIKAKQDTYWSPGIFLKLDDGTVVKFYGDETGAHNDRWFIVEMKEVDNFPKQIRDQEDD